MCALLRTLARQHSVSPSLRQGGSAWNSHGGSFSVLGSLTSRRPSPPADQPRCNAGKPGLSDVRLGMYVHTLTDSRLGDPTPTCSSIRGLLQDACSVEPTLR